MRKCSKLLCLLLVLVMLAGCTTAQQPNDTTTATDPSTSATTPSETETTGTEPTDTNTTAPSGTATTPTDPTTEGTTGEATDPTTIPTDPTTGTTTPPTTTPTDPTNPPTTKPTDPTNPPSTQPTTPKDYTLKLNTNSFELTVGDTYTLSYTFTGTGSLSWKTSNSSVATVSNGKVTAKAAGSAVITLTDGTKNAQCAVTVTAPTTEPTQPTQPPTQPVTLTINTANWTDITAGVPFQIDYTYSGDKSELTWSSSDTSVLTVDSNGVVTGKAFGGARVKVTNGSITKQVWIGVTVYAEKSTSIDEESHNAPLYDGVTKYAGDYMTFKAKAQPSESNTDIVVTTSNSSVVSVSCEGASGKYTLITLRFKSAGSATITITSADGNVSKSYTINVKGSYPSPHGYGQLTPEQFVDCYNAVSSAWGMENYCIPSGYLVLTLSDAELTWANASSFAEGRAHQTWLNGHRNLVLTYEGVREDGEHVFHIRMG